VVIVSPRAAGRNCAGMALLRDRAGRTLVAIREVLPTANPTEATLMMVWRLLREAQRQRVSRVAVHLSDGRAARILARQEEAPPELAQWYFAARTASNRLGSVRFRALGQRYVERLKGAVQRAVEESQSRRLSLFSEEEDEAQAAPNSNVA